jgi:ribosomal protein L37AE/L43A
MKSYAVCPCCSSKLIHHISNHRDYWFCRSCWQEMPAIEMEIVNNMEYYDRQPTLSNIRKPQSIRLSPI